MKKAKRQQETAGQKILRARQERGLSRDELAKLAGIDRVTVYRIETGRTEGYERTVRKLVLALAKVKKLPRL